MRRAGWILIPLFFALVSLAPFVRRAELWTIDQRFLRRAEPPTSGRVVVVALDDKTDRAWKAEPMAFWGKHIARLIDRCVAGGARSIGVDVLLQIDTDDYLEGLGITSTSPNLDLENAIAAAHGRVVLARTLSAVPLESMVQASGGNLGLADLPESEDGVRRSVIPDHQVGSWTYPSLAEAVAKTAGYKSAEPFSGRIDFRRSHVPTYSALDVIHGRFPPEAFRDKIVMIGVTFAGNGDFQVTPIQPLMPGIQLQAQAAETLADGRQVVVPPVAWYPAIALACSAPLALLSRKLRWTYVAIGVTLTLAIYSWICFGLAGESLFLPMAPVWLAAAGSLLLAYSVRGAEELMLRSRAEAVFGAFVSEKVRDVVLADRGPIGSAPATEVEGTCLFLDIRGFVAISSTLSADELVGTLNQFFEGALAAVQAHDGLVSVFTGDGFLAVFGAPIPDPHHAERAWLAAQAIMTSLNEFNESRPGSPWRVGIGLHSGTLHSGYVGAAGRFTYTVMGDVVNLSARIQDSTKNFGRSIAISAATWAMLETPPKEFQWVEVPIKGKDSQIPIYYV